MTYAQNWRNQKDIKEFFDRGTNKMENIIRCQNCGKEIIAEEKSSHKCYGIVKEIPISFFYSVTESGRSTLICKGLDGGSIPIGAETRR